MPLPKELSGLVASGDIKRGEAPRIAYDQIHIEPGFNLRNPGVDPESADDDQELVTHIFNGGQVPDIVLRPRAEGGMWLVDGHRRHWATGEAFKQGASQLADKDGVLRMQFKLFKGSEIDRNAYLLTSNRNRQLSALQLAEGYKRLQRFGMSNAEIARLTNKSPTHVADILSVGLAKADVQQQVRTGVVAANVAAKVIKQHGEQAGKVIADAAAKKGGAKVKPSDVLRPQWATPPREQALRDALTAIDLMLQGDSINPAEIRASIAKALA